MSQYVPKECLWTEFGGDLDFEYDHSVYWPAFNKLAGEKRAARQQRWEAGGKHIGEKEDYLNGHMTHGIAPPPAPIEANVDVEAASTTDDEVKEATEGVANVKIDSEAKEEQMAIAPEDATKKETEEVAKA